MEGDLANLGGSSRQGAVLPTEISDEPRQFSGQLFPATGDPFQATEEQFQAKEDLALAGEPLKAPFGDMQEA